MKNQKLKISEIKTEFFIIQDYSEENSEKFKIIPKRFEGRLSFLKFLFLRGPVLTKNLKCHKNQKMCFFFLKSVHFHLGSAPAQRKTEV